MTHIEFDCGEHYAEVDSEWIGSRKLASTRCPQCQVSFGNYVEFQNISNKLESEAK